VTRQHPPDDVDALEIHLATPERWGDLTDLFERRGPRGGRPYTDECWCMFWRRRTGDGGRNRRALSAIVEGGREPGLIAYRDGRPVGWVSIGPREEFGQLLRSPTYRPRDQDDGVFSIVCFYVHPAAKRDGVATALLDAAVSYARGRGARWVEGYAPEAPDYMGWRSGYERAGFTPVRTAGKRTVMRLDLGPG
jgi:GNAT superfamily N-acetyltransferase